MPKLNKHQLQGCYEAFWDRFRKQAKRLSLGVWPASEYPFSIDDQKPNFLTVQTIYPIYLQGWPESPNIQNPAASPTVDILVFGEESIDVQTKLVRHSAINVEYYSVKPTTQVALPRELIRYDFKAPAEKSHPLFHAQFSHAPCADADRLKNAKIQWTSVDRKNRWTPVSSLRIPTAHMSLSSVFISLCADHNAYDEFAVFHRDLLAARHKIPCADSTALDYHDFRQMKRGGWESLVWYPVEGRPQHFRAGRSASLKKSA